MTKERKMNLIFLGPPGVGKGTHAGIAGEELGIPQISTGDLFRAEIKNQTELGKKAKEYIDRGELVPDEITVAMLKERISRPDCERGFILDGFPRTIAQAEALEGITKIDLVVNMVASDETIIDRITNRWTCRKCGAIYNSKTIPPKVEGVCDKCGGELYQREDQKRDVVENRLKVYEKQTAPLIDYYKEKGLLVDVDAEGPKEEVNRRVMETIREHLKVG